MLSQHKMFNSSKTFKSKQCSPVLEMILIEAMEELGVDLGEMFLPRLNH